ncbi:hypothetical protein [Subtercola boreus]|uniref:Uncharacterized protein n=1 Tax=Subtercola boreus TaxID=120213 RepID=A0A3E0W9U6_9MICO|nr:hypothetical protein [Subtercola boreus]RFA20610.1 hypothetical protein B7R24_09270 [Subtercola boreus]RFA20724.1 hypothetical protein B7R23_09205 [Subtercola boreus]RFA26935.1 hypothetical protein B7R25_09335 [Subtercola boreus]
MKRKKLPLWRWDPFLAGLVLGLSVVAALFQRLDIDVVSPIVLTVLLIAAIAAALALVLPLFVPALRRDGEGTLTLNDRITLVPLPTTETFPVVDGHRHQTSVDAALARGGSEVTAVLVPGATAWMGRDLRVAVDAVVGTHVYRLGYLPREIDQQTAAALQPLASQGLYRTVPASILNQKRPYRVLVALGPSLSELPPAS